MRLAVANQAWSPSEERVVLRAIARHAEGVGVSMQRLEEGVRTSRQTVLTRARAYKRLLADYGLKAPILQNLGHGGMGEGMQQVFDRCRMGLEVAQELGATALVVLGPSYRRGAAGFRAQPWDWEHLAQRGQEAGIAVVIEPVPRVYGARFWTSFDEVAVDAAQYGLEVGVDTCALSYERSPRSTLMQFTPTAPYIAVSEPGLGPIRPRGTVPHRQFGSDLGRLARQDRAAPWLMLRQRPMDGGDAVLESLARIRVLYAGGLRTVPF